MKNSVTFFFNLSKILCCAFLTLHFNNEYFLYLIFHISASYTGFLKEKKEKENGKNREKEKKKKKKVDETIYPIVSLSTIATATKNLQNKANVSGKLI